jgi:16S rRNA (cytosine1402-N4)-methyltransferase
VPAYHQPVLLREVLDLLRGATHIIDGTLGGGGHTRAFLETGARVTAIDRDADARRHASAELASYIETGKLRIIDGTFAGVAENADVALEPVDGVLLDLGVSSHQFDDEARGFTFREGAGLDMRMGTGHGAWGTASELLNMSSVDDLTKVFREFGDEHKAFRLAKVIAKRRETRAFQTSDDLVGAIREALGPRSGPPEFARLFQAVRIAVNDELGELGRALPAFKERIEPGGVIAVISYHSGEDRLTKRAFQEWSRSCVCPPLQPMCTCGGVAEGDTLTRKPVEASGAEVEQNSRARSAKLRAWRKRRTGA